MAGVAGPMLKRSRSRGTRFLVGLLAGEAIAAGLMSLAVYVLGEGLGLILGAPWRESLTGIAVVVFGFADMANRTPHIWRQVPQEHVRTMPPGMLGLTWGFDLGLLFTTQKSTSLTWGVLVAALLLHPASSSLLLVGMALAGVAAVSVRSVTWFSVSLTRFGDRVQPWFPWMRRTAGLGLVLVGAYTVWTAWR
ncbi:hypothetical protein [Streptomyces beijiangensis]|uniref:Uncharacterized protein n=1 Tax=Streptomyces beijiangensis TaxID=163361 RepID=A0A939F4P2_9ACTN|nr:hypothetical protein [Streptomyces beijiangensis]MBO0512245.1 hypothetical protein [Streptomyces beijiangensis]